MRSTARYPLVPLVACALIGAATAGATASSAAAQCKGSAKAGSKLGSKQARRATVCLVNRARRARGMGRLKVHRAQRKAAQRHSRTMVKERCFSHVCPGEKDLVGRLIATGYLPCGCSWGLGENIGFGFGPKSSPRHIVRSWMGSPGHRANILGRSFEHVGVGVERGAPSGRGPGATYTIDFGYRD